jgi:CubicO group peptidase (beta-lactamase class C family)
MSVPVFLCRTIVAASAFVLGLSVSNALAAGQSARDADVDRVFAKWNAQTPGCAVAVNTKGGQEVAKAYGMADLEHGIKNSIDTIFEAGSVSKQFTATAILMLARDGKLSLDDPARKYVPELPDYGMPVTIREMLAHTSGLRDWGDIAAIEGWPRGTKAYDDADILRIVSKQRELNFVPDTRWSYSNTGYNLAAIIVSRVSGMSLAEFTRQRIFLPMGMTHSSWRDDYTRVVPGRAVAYSRKGDGFHADMPFEKIYGNGGLLTTVGDLQKWNEHLSAPDAVDSELVESLQVVHRLVSGRPTNYGYGLFVRQFKGIPEISHTGQTAGYTSFLARYPSQGLSIVMLCNVAEVNTWEYGHAIADIWIPAPQGRQLAHAKAYDLSPAESKRLVGTYRDVLTGRPTKISAESGKIQFGVDSVMSPISATRFAMDGKTAVIDARGAIIVSDAYGIVDEYQQVTLPSPSPGLVANVAGRYTSSEVEGDVTVVPSGASIVVQLGTKTTLMLAPSYDFAFSKNLMTAIFSHDEGGKAMSMTISDDRVWKLDLGRVKD